MLDWKTHLIVAPIILPLVTAAVLLLFDERKRNSRWPSTPSRHWV